MALHWKRRKGASRSSGFATLRADRYAHTLIVCTSALLVAVPATAQVASPPVKADSLSLRDTLPTVVVTVLRTRTDINRVPFAVSSVGANEIHGARAGFALDDALRNVPGVQVDNRFNFALGERISIRGFGARAQFGVRGLKIIVDGIPATLPDGQSALNNIDLGVIGRAEVERGPMASLFGNAAGGVIQLESLAPPDSSVAQTLRIIGGSDGLRRAQSTTAGVHGPFSYSLTGSRLDYAGYRAFNSAHNAHVSGTFGMHGASDELKLAVNWVNYRADNPGGLSDSMLAANRRQANSFNVQQQTGETGKQGQYGLTWRHQLGSGYLDASAYTLSRGIDNPIPPRIIELERIANGARFAFTATPKISTLSIQTVIGAETDGQRDDRQNYTNSSGSRGTRVLNQLEHVRSLAGFANLAIAAGDHISLLGGFRYDHFRFAVSDRLITPSNPDDSGERTMQAASPSLGVTYSIAPAMHLYANVATSFETPTTTELANRPDGAGGFNPELQPQHTRSGELGAKGTVGEKGSYQLALYRAAVRNTLIPYEVPSVPGRQFYRNAGSATHRGVEAGATLLISPMLTARASYTYVDARFDRYVVDTTSLAGDRVPGVAPHHATASLAYESASGALLAVDGRATSSTFVNDANTARSPGYAIVDVRGALPRLGRSGLSPFAGITNLFGRVYNSSVVINAAGGRYYEPGPRRELYVGLDASVARR